MKILRLCRPHTRLVCEETPIPTPRAHQVLLRVRACGVCRTDLHLMDGELPNARYPVVPGHEIVGVVASRGTGAQRFALGARVGVPWLGATCGACEYCLTGRENLCDNAGFTGCTLDGGYAEYAIADERFCLPIPACYSDAEAAPLLCAGLIGFRSYRAAGDGRRLGIYGFGAAAHLIAQIAIAQGRDVYAFTRDGDEQSQHFALELGARWAGSSASAPPVSLDAAIIFAPVGALVPRALVAVGKGGRIVCGGIHMSDIPGFPYELLWGERSICSIANLTRADGEEFMKVAADIRLSPSVERFELADANAALERLRTGALQGAAVLEMGGF